MARERKTGVQLYLLSMADCRDAACQCVVRHGWLLPITCPGCQWQGGKQCGVAIALCACGRIAIGEPGAVPAGKYANQALASVGLYTEAEGEGGSYASSIADKVSLADKVGTAAQYVSTGDCTIGFVYTSDVYRYDGIEVAYTCPDDSHKPIVYPGAVSAASKKAEAAADFLEFCMTDEDALAIWAEYGFELA